MPPTPDITRDPPLSLRELLAFYVESGVDCALMEEPVNRLAEDSAPAVSLAPKHPPLVRDSEKPKPSAQPRDVSAVPELALAAANEAAAGAMDLASLREAMESFGGCALKTTATRLVFADGNSQAKLMLVGEAPGREEDLDGLPFVGRAGKLLDLMLAAIGLNRSLVYLSNVIPWRPPGNRDPAPAEIQTCLPFIKRHIELVNPDILVTLGHCSAKALFGTRDGMMKARGRWRDYDTGTRSIKAIATFHPDYLLQHPTYKRMAWLDLRAIAAALASKT
jgi:DNA polymerase